MPRTKRTLDIETYQDYFLIRIEDKEAPHTVHRFPLYSGVQIDRQALANLINDSELATFNGWNYDIPLMTYALYGASNTELKMANDAIITQGMKPWQFYSKFGIQELPYLDHVDLMEVAPGVGIGLKMYMGRIHAPNMQDLPFDPNESITPVKRVVLDTYCGNDHEGTRLLWEGLAERLQLRIALGEKYGIDLRSKSDAQIAEAIIRSEWIKQEKAARGGWVERPKPAYVPHGTTFKYTPPAYIDYVTPQMRALLDDVRNADFLVCDKEEAILMMDFDNIRTGVQIPAELSGRDIVIGTSRYRMGIGGLHSQESNVKYITIPGVREVSDHDVASYYPSLIRTMGMYPAALGERFLAIYGDIIDQRLAAKAAGRKIEADGLKIVGNGTFGKLLSKYSIFYAPQLGIRVTITGQLALLMLIERLELSGISVVSANTDGIVLSTPWHLRWVRDEIMRWWQTQTGLVLEDSFYRGIYMRDVNNYVAIIVDGKAKRKGVFTAPGLLNNKHPDKAICAEAVVQFLQNGTPIEATIRNCKDIRQFLVVRAVKGGAVHASYPAYAEELDRLDREVEKAKRKHGDQSMEHQDAQRALENHRWIRNDFPYLGKAVRWYYGAGKGCIAYASNGNKVAGSEGATPIMRLPDALPVDVNYQHYIDVANLMLESIGFGLQH